MLQNVKPSTIIYNMYRFIQGISKINLIPYILKGHIF